LRIIKRERPDFEVVCGTDAIGIEFTEANQQDYIEATMLPEAQGEVCTVDRSLFRVGERKSKAKQRRIASQSGLTGPG
jgi:hypothetical protein